VLFLKLVRTQLRYSDEQWLEVMDQFFDPKDVDKSLPMDTLNHRDFCAQLRRYGVFTVAMYREGRLPKFAIQLGCHSAICSSHPCRTP
jgi:hypothetical protein